MDTDSFSTAGTLFPTGIVVAVLSAWAVVSLVLGALTTYYEYAATAVDIKKLQASRYARTTQGRRLLRVLTPPQRALFSFVTTKAFLYLSFTLAIFSIFNQLDWWLPERAAFLASIPAASCLIAIFAEALPRRLSTGKIGRSMRLTRGIYSVYLFSRPLTILFEYVFRLRDASYRQNQELSIGELSKVLDLTHEEISEGKDLLEGLIRFNDKSAVEIMTPREDMACLDISVSLSEITYYVSQMHYSRIPIYDKTEDNIRGILYVKDLLPVMESDKGYRWQQLIRPAFFVPETKKIDALLKEFRSNKIHLAVVVDEYGGTSGLVTLEDVLEEIVGEISDEYDDEQKTFVRLADGSLIFEGKTLLTDFFKMVEADQAEFEEVTEEVDTLAGLILELKGDFPRRQEIVTFKGYQFQVLEMNKRRIVKVKFTIPKSKNENG